MSTRAVPNVPDWELRLLAVLDIWNRDNAGESLDPAEDVVDDRSAGSMLRGWLLQDTADVVRRAVGPGPAADARVLRAREAFDKTRLTQPFHRWVRKAILSAAKDNNLNPFALHARFQRQLEERLHGIEVSVAYRALSGGPGNAVMGELVGGLPVDWTTALAIRPKLEDVERRIFQELDRRGVADPQLVAEQEKLAALRDGMLDSTSALWLQMNAEQRADAACYLTIADRVQLVQHIAPWVDLPELRKTIGLLDGYPEVRSASARFDAHLRDYTTGRGWVSAPELWCAVTADVLVAFQQDVARRRETAERGANEDTPAPGRLGPDVPGARARPSRADATVSGRRHEQSATSDSAARTAAQRGGRKA